MGKLFDTHARLFDGLIYDRDVYGKRPGCDPDLICQGLAPITDIERRGMNSLSEVELELMTHKLSSIVEEARDVYTALSISEGAMLGDMNCGIFTASGDPAAVGTGIYFHTLLNNAQLKYILKYYRDDPSVGLADGDMFFFNEELAGGVHNLDMFAAMPIFFEGELIAWAEVGGHQGETGSITPGGFAPTAVSRYEEGFHMPCVRIGRNFRLRQDILDYMAGTVRNGFIFTVDLKSRLATLFQIRNRVIREVEKRGVEAVVGGMRRMLIKGEADARARLREIDDGIFRSILFNDENGTFFGLTRIPLTVYKEGDALTVVLQGVSPENGMGPYHATWHLSRAATAVYLFSYFFRGITPPNAGLLEPVTYYIEGPSIMNSNDELAHGLANHVCSFVTQNMYMVGAKMLFPSPYREAVQAPHSRNYCQPVFAGLNRRGYYAANISGTANSAGGGGRFDMDGEPALGFYWAPFADAGEIEDMDERQPHFILSRKLDKNFHGFGKYRGGTPLLEVSTVCGDAACAISSWGSCDKVSFNYGLFGGYAGPPNPRFVIRNSDVFEQLRAGREPAIGQYDLLTRREVAGDYILTSSAQNAQEFHEGDMILHSVGAAGGYGDVLERDPADVRFDLEDEQITREVAETVYCVDIDPVTGHIDDAKTAQRRARMRRERLDKGKPFDVFIKRWNKLKPPDDVLAFYGNWPEPRLERYDRPFWGLYA